MSILDINRHNTTDSSGIPEGELIRESLQVNLSETNQEVLKAINNSNIYK